MRCTKPMANDMSLALKGPAKYPRLTGHVCGIVWSVSCERNRSKAHLFLGTLSKHYSTHKSETPLPLQWFVGSSKLKEFPQAILEPSFSLDWFQPSLLNLRLASLSNVRAHSFERTFGHLRHIKIGQSGFDQCSKDSIKKFALFNSIQQDLLLIS